MTNCTLMSSNYDRFSLSHSDMDDDFLAGHVLPLANHPQLLMESAMDELLDAHVGDVQRTTSSAAATGIEITLNATTEHVELTSKFFNNPLLSDIRLRVGATVYHAHKFILAKSSDVLATLLYSQHWTSTEVEIVLEEQVECQGDVFER